MARVVMSSCLGLALIGLMAASAPAGKYNRVVNVGDKAAGWKGLVGTDGKPHSLADYADSQAVAVVFTCNNCPVAIAYQSRLKQITKDYGGRGLALIAVNVNQGESLEAMKQRSEEEEYNFSYVYDDSQESAKQYGATCTPHVFLLDKNRRIAYMGAIDDNWSNAEEAEQHYLRDAIDAVLAGKTPEVQETRQQGCQIKWKD